ncbi:MAG: response regulator [Synergistaceae bacterium]|nr:response regulator [Synergistaceae bacterium]
MSKHVTEEEPSILNNRGGRAANDAYDDWLPRVKSRRAMKAVDYKNAIKANHRELFFTCATFVILVLVICFYMSNIVHRQMDLYSDSVMSISQARLQALIEEHEMALEDVAVLVASALDRGAGQKELNDLMIFWTNTLLERENFKEILLVVYGYLDGNYVDGEGWRPSPEEYFPPSRPWYGGAVERGGKVYQTPAYKDAKTGLVVGSMSRVIFDGRGKSRGVLSVDFILNPILDQVRSLKLAGGGYGILLDSSFNVVSHPQGDFVGRHFRNLPAYEPVYEHIQRQGASDSPVRFKDYDGVESIGFFNRLSNAWYLGIVVPRRFYYKEVYDMIPVISAVALFLMGILCCVLVRFSAAKTRSDKESQSKSSFLARMSHDIRTPLNAILGISELALRADDLPSIWEHVTKIQHAGRNLLSVVNDILDFSKIESGNLEITPAPYELASLLNDLVNVVSVHVNEKPIVFTVNVDGSLPNNLIGDETRVRQILINLLENAVKYTCEGYVKFTVSAHLAENDAMLFSFEVADSGVGIKQEDFGRLFGNFTRLDTKINARVEGTGLGLTIAQNLCREMGGDVSVSSVYGKGSTFTATLLQKFAGEDRLAVVENPDDKKTLIYDARVVYAESVFATLENLGVPALMATNDEEFFGKLESREFKFAFVARRVAEVAADFITRLGLRTRLVLLADLNASSFKNIPTILMPAYSVSIANVLNGVVLTNGGRTSPIRFVAPEARVLVVDDNRTNLAVAAGLLAPYQARVQTCESGEDAVTSARTHRYDLVFMDHMMPGMDGVETTVRLRAMEGFKNTPIIALTANAIFGMREMFLEYGMDDFLPKPIDSAELESILYKWLPRDKLVTTRKTEPPSREKPNVINIEGIDMEMVLRRFGDRSDAHLQALRSYAKYTPEVLDKLRTPSEDLYEYMIHVHGIKGSSYGIGANAVGELAEELEKDAKMGDFAAVRAKNDVFIRAVEKLIAELSIALGGMKGSFKEEDKEQKNAPDPALERKLLEYCAHYDIWGMEKALLELERYRYESKNELVEWLREKLDNLEYEQIRERIEWELEGSHEGQPAGSDI